MLLIRGLGFQLGCCRRVEAAKSDPSIVSSRHLQLSWKTVSIYWLLERWQIILGGNIMKSFSTLSKAFGSWTKSYFTWKLMTLQQSMLQ